MNFFRRHNNQKHHYTFIAKVIRSMYVKRDETLYVQFKPVGLDLYSPVFIRYRNAIIEGEVTKFTKSGIILTNWKITNTNF